MAKSTTKLFETTLLTQPAKGGGFGASLVFHVVLGLTLVSLPVTYVERWAESERLAVVPLTVPSTAELKNLDRPQPKPRDFLKSPAASQRLPAPRFEKPAPEKLQAPSRATVPVEPASLLARTSPVRPPPRVELPPVPAIRPPVRTGLLSNATPASPKQAPSKLRVQAGMFAEVELDDTRRPYGVATRTGAFEAAAETRAATAGAPRRTVLAANFRGPNLHNDSRIPARGKVVAASSFGAATATRGVLGKVSEAVQPTAFEDVVAGQLPRKRPRATTKKDLSGQVRIIEKPRPSYTAPAREQQIEGEVVLDVLFEASGTIQVLGVIQGLGYGLDERAAEAARKICFEPAEREGKPIDSRARLRITFQLAY
jgi:TonB family protein